MKNGTKMRKFWSPEAGNEALQSSRRRRKDGSLRLPKFNFLKVQTCQIVFPSGQPKTRNNWNAELFQGLKRSIIIIIISRGSLSPGPPGNDFLIFWVTVSKIFRSPWNFGKWNFDKRRPPSFRRRRDDSESAFPGSADQNFAIFDKFFVFNC